MSNRSAPRRASLIEAIFSAMVCLCRRREGCCVGDRSIVMVCVSQLLQALGAERWFAPLLGRLAACHRATNAERPPIIPEGRKKGGVGGPWRPPTPTSVTQGEVAGGMPKACSSSSIDVTWSAGGGSMVTDCPKSQKSDIISTALVSPRNSTYDAHAGHQVDL